jgi:serine/threonine protein kinase
VLQNGNIVLTLSRSKKTVMERQENQNDDLIGMTLAERFLITGKLGQGGMGEIYTAHDSILARDVAIKTIARTNLNDTELIRFQREAKAASTLKHPNVIQMLDFGVSEHGQPFMVMELIQGISLAELLNQRGPVSPHFVLQIIEQVADGMIGVHKSGILHRDLKTGNIMLLQAGLLTNQPLIKILDFGIAKSLGPAEQVSTLTRAGQIFGSPNSMSPEQARGDDLDQRSDIYSLGCIAFELLTGRPLFTGDSVIEVVTKHLEEPPPRLWEVSNRKFPMELERLVAHMVLKDPAERYQSMEEVLKNLREVYSVINIGEAYVDKAVQTDAEFDALPEPSSTTRIKTGGLIATVIAATGVFAACVWFLVNNSLTDHRIEVTSHAKRTIDLQSESLLLVDTINGQKDDLNFVMNHSGRVTATLEKMVAAKRSKSDLMLIDSELRPEDAALIAKLSPGFVNLAGCTGVSNKFLKELSKIPSITVLTLNRVKSLTPESLAQLSNFPRLVLVSVANCDLTDAHLKALGRCKKLGWVRLSENKKITLAGIKHLGGKRFNVEVTTDNPSVMVMKEAERKVLKDKYKISVVHLEALPEEMSLKNMGRIGGLAMDNLFGPVDDTTDHQERNMEILQKLP